MNMSPTFIGLLLGLAGLLLLLYLLDRKKRPGERITSKKVKKNIEEWGEDNHCNHCTGGCCDTERLNSSLSDDRKRIEYFDDEELDRFQGRLSNSYSLEEIHEFEEILRTLLPNEISEWQNSLHARGIVLPEQLSSIMSQRLEEEKLSST